MLIGVTQFFRDKKLWEYLSDHAFPELLSSYPEGRNLRAWIAACSTGEEAYSLAIAFQDCIEAMGCEAIYSLQIYATDLNDAAINIAREGKYQKQIEKDISPARLNKYFIKEEHGYRISKKIREMVTFAPQNIIADPPFTKLDILGCRNLLIYFNPELQERLIPLFHYALNPNGLLMIWTNGDVIADFLLPEEKEKYASGQFVFRGQYKEGRKMFLSFHPSEWVQGSLLKGYQILKHYSGGFSGSEQDIWIARIQK